MTDRTQYRFVVLLGFALISTAIATESSEAQIRRLFQNRRAGQRNLAPMNGQGQRFSQNAPISQNSGWAGQIEVNQKTVDFGVVPRASKQEFTFELSNPLEGELRILSANTSCGCTKTEVLTPQVGPGETGRVLAKFDTVGFAGDRGASINIRVLDVQTNQIGEVQVQVKGQIRQDVVFSPAEINFSDVAPGESATRLARLYYAGNPDWKIISVKSTNPNISARATEVGREPAKRKIIYDLEVTLDPDQPAGTLSDQLVIVTNEPTRSEVRVNVLGNIKRSIQAADIALGAIPPGESLQRKLIVRGDEPFSIESIAADDSRLSFSPQAGARKLHVVPYTVDVSNPGNIETTIHVRTDNADQPELEIRFTGQIKEP